jgi:Icc protein
VAVPDPEPELHTVADDGAVVHRGATVTSYDDLTPSTGYRFDGVAFSTLPRPGGERLATVATVNDLHFGEVECGRVHGEDVGPILRSPAGAPPYPAMMAAAAAAEIAGTAPDLVVAKGDLTADGCAEQYAAFQACWSPAVGDRLVVTLGNHDHPAAGPAFAAPPLETRTLDGVTVAVVDTSRPGHAGGWLSGDALEALDELAGRADRPVLVFGHHPVRDAGAADWMGDGSALDQPSTDALVALVARRPAVRGYFAGHTHRNRVRRFPASGAVPFAEVAATKDFPGSWAEYRVFEGGVLAVHRRISSPPALEWSEKCRALVFGLYPRYALGALDDRCFVVCAE